MMSFWKRFSYNRGAVIGLVTLAFVVPAAILAPILFPQSPWKMVQRPFLPPFTQDGLMLGTDALGRNVLSGLAHGACVGLGAGMLFLPSVAIVATYFTTHRALALGVTAVGGSVGKFCPIAP